MWHNIVFGFEHSTSGYGLVCATNCTFVRIQYIATAVLVGGRSRSWGQHCKVHTTVTGSHGATQERRDYFARGCAGIDGE